MLPVGSPLIIIEQGQQSASNHISFTRQSWTLYTLSFSFLVCFFLISLFEIFISSGENSLSLFGFQIQRAKISLVMSSLLSFAPFYSAIFKLYKLVQHDRMKVLFKCLPIHPIKRQLA